MNREDITHKIVEATDLTQAKAEEALTAFLDTIKDSLKKGEKVALPGFGSFSVVDIERPEWVETHRQASP